MTSLFSTAYLPPISYILECMNADEIQIEQHEHYLKQTYRNRCRIYGPNGLQSLSIPVIHENLFRTPIKDIKISYDASWNKVHWKAICSAYRNSPFFEFYEEEILGIYERKIKFLFELNMTFLDFIFKAFRITKPIKLTENFQEIVSGISDHRSNFHPKKENLKLESYHQVFDDRHGFINDLSCIDYLFNIGGKTIPKINS